MKNTGYQVIVGSLVLNVLITGTLFSQPGDYLAVYHPAINSAEMAIVNRAYADASRQYEKAFRSVNAPFAKDYYNAAVCAILLKKHARAFRYLDKLAEKGVDSAFLAKPIFDPLRRTHRWKKWIVTYPGVRRKAMRRIDTALHNELVRLYEDYQRFRKKRNPNESYSDSIWKTDAENVARLKEIITTSGYPDENRLGLQPGSVRAIDPSYIIIHHHYQKDYFELTPLLLTQVKRGKLPPKVFAGQVEAWGSGVYKTKLFTKYDSTLLMESIFTAEEKAEINRARLAVGLETVDEWRQKILFEQTNQLFLPVEKYVRRHDTSSPFVFDTQGGVFTMVGLDEASKARIISSAATSKTHRMLTERELSARRMQ